MAAVLTLIHLSLVWMAVQSFTKSTNQRCALLSPCNYSPDLNMKKHLVVICICCSYLCCFCISMCVHMCGFIARNWWAMCQTICLQLRELQYACIHMATESVKAHPDLEHTQTGCILFLPSVALVLMRIAETTFTIAALAAMLPHLAASCIHVLTILYVVHIDVLTS